MKSRDKRRYTTQSKKKKRRNRSLSSTLRIFVLFVILLVFSYIIFEVFDKNKKHKSESEEVKVVGGGLRSSRNIKDNPVDNDSVNIRLKPDAEDNNNINNINSDDGEEGEDNNINKIDNDLHNIGDRNRNHGKLQEDDNTKELNGIASIPKRQQDHPSKSLARTNVDATIANSAVENDSTSPQLSVNAHRDCNLLPVSRCTMKNPGIVILSHDRVEYVINTIKSLLKMPKVQNYKVYVSIDDPNSFNAIESAVNDAVKPFQTLHPNFRINTWRKGRIMTGHQWYSSALSKIAQHFKFVLNKGFMDMQHSHLIMIEDDLLLGKDFLQLFEETAWLIEAEPDKTYCISAWNDNGLKEVVRQTEEGKANLLRTGYFPGLGWMTTRKVWLDLRLRWPDKPTTGWDHWLRLSTSMNGKECIYPEIPRTKHVSTHGTNVNSQSAIAKFQKYAFVDDINTDNNQQTKFINTQDLLYSNYEQKMKARVLNAHRVSHISEVEFYAPTNDVNGVSESLAFLILYKREDYEYLAPRVGLPRTQARGWHKGIVQTFLKETSKYRGKQLFLADKRAAKYIHEHEKIKPNVNMKLVGAQRGEDCSSACRRNNLRCTEEDLAFANDCEKFKGIFECEKGCGHQVGAEIPCYVAKKSEPTFQQCLISDSGRNSCSASHPATKRLCACS
jgi:hypothetical protein